MCVQIKNHRNATFGFDGFLVRTHGMNICKCEIVSEWATNFTKDVNIHPSLLRPINDKIENELSKVKIANPSVGTKVTTFTNPSVGTKKNKIGQRSALL